MKSPAGLTSILRHKSLCKEHDKELLYSLVLSAWAHWALPAPLEATWAPCVTLCRYNQWPHSTNNSFRFFWQRKHHLGLLYVPHGFTGIGQVLLKFRLLRSFSASPSSLWSFPAWITLPFLGVHTIPSTLHYRFGSKNLYHKQKSLYHNTIIYCLALPIYQILPKIPCDFGSCISTSSLSRCQSFIIPFNSRLISNLTNLLQFGHLIIWGQSATGNICRTLGWEEPFPVRTNNYS